MVDPVMILAVVLGIALASNRPLARPKLTLVADRVSDCSDIVDQVISRTKGRLLSIRPHDDRCTVTVLVPRDGDRPQKIVVRVQYADDDLGQNFPSNLDAKNP